MMQRVEKSGMWKKFAKKRESSTTPNLITNEHLQYILIFCILIGIFARFYGIGRPFLIHDEGEFVVSGIKLHHANPYDARFYGVEHPVVARWFLGLPTRFIKADYSDTLAIPPQMFVWRYRAPFKETYVAMRRMGALGGSAALIFIFLITKELYGRESALWATAFAALSLDLISHDRVLYLNTYMHLFALGTVYFYVKYLKSKNDVEKNRFMVLTFLFLTLGLGTRNYQPMFMLPILGLSQLLLKKGESSENTKFFGGMAASLFVFWYVIHPPVVRKAAMEVHYQAESMFQLLNFGFTMPEVIKILFLRNSYLFALALVLLAYEALMFMYSEAEAGTKSKIVKELQTRARTFDYLQGKLKLSTDVLLEALEEIGAKEVRERGRYTWALKGGPKRQRGNMGKVREYFRSSGPELVIILFFLISFLISSLVKGRTAPYYLSFLFLPVFILGGKLFAKYSRSPAGSIGLVALLILNIYGIWSTFPTYDSYINFGVKDMKYETYGGGRDEYSQKQVLSFLEEMGSPPILTNGPNFLIFYKGESRHLIIPNEGKCNPEEVAALAEKGTYIVYSHLNDIKEDPYVCPYLGQAPLTLLKSFGNTEPLWHVYKW